MEVKIFVDSKGHEVRQFSQVFGKSKKPDFYMGTANLRIRMRAPTGQDVLKEVPLEFPFPEGVSLKKVFETFDEEAKKHVDEFAKKQREIEANKRIVPASSIPKLSILGADGKPAGG